MKNTKAIIFLICLLTAVACKKKKTVTPDPEPQVNCDIVLEKNLFGDKYTYEYDDLDRIIKEYLNDTLLTTISYEDNGKKIIETASDAVRTFILNSRNLPEKQIQSNNIGDVFNTFYFYDNNDKLIEIRRENFYSNGTSGSDTTYLTNTVANENIIKTINSSPDGTVGSTFVFTHDLVRSNNFPDAKPYRPMDLFNPNDDHNLLTKLSVTGISSPFTLDFSYKFDSKERIATQYWHSVQGGQANDDSVSFKYRCD